METKVEGTRLTEKLLVSSDIVETLAEQRVGPGILLLSPAVQLIHMNPQAWELCGRIMRAKSGKATAGGLPTAVAELCAEVITMLQVRTDRKSTRLNSSHLV